MRTESKICRKCNREKPIDSFRVQKKKYGDFCLHTCKQCELKIGSEKYYYKKSLIVVEKIKSLEGEVWLPIPGFEGLYEASTMARIKSLERKVRAINSYSYRTLKERILRQTINKQNKYPYVHLSKEGININRTVHTLVADAFIPNPLNLPEVNHINGIRSDCALINLERCTTADNAKHKFDVLGYKYPMGENNVMSKGVIIIYPDGHEEYVKGCGEAGRRLGASGGQMISKVINGQRKSYKGHKFRYSDLKIA